MKILKNEKGAIGWILLWVLGIRFLSCCCCFWCAAAPKQTLTAHSL